MLALEGISEHIFLASQGKANHTQEKKMLLGLPFLFSTAKRIHCHSNIKLHTVSAIIWVEVQQGKTAKAVKEQR